MDQLVEQIDSKTGRKIYHYIGSDGVKGKIVSRKQHLIDLKEQGKLLNLNVEEISFTHFESRDVVRHSIVQSIVDAYDAFDKANLSP